MQRLQLPQQNPHVRVDAGVIEGDTVTIFYDPMIAKVVVWDRTRTDALQRMREALAQCDIVGTKSNIDFLERLVRHPAVIEGRIDTGYLDRHLDEFLPIDAAPDAATLFAAATAVLLSEESQEPWVLPPTHIHPGRMPTRGGLATRANASFALYIPSNLLKLKHTAAVEIMHCTVDRTGARSAMGS